MDLMQSFDAILFPADGRPPHVVSLMTSPASFSNPHTPAQMNPARIPHPEVHMEYIAEDANMRAWHYLVRGCVRPLHALQTLSHRHTRHFFLDRRGARHDEQEVRKSIYHLLPRHLARRHAVPREPHRARYPGRGEQGPPRPRRPALARTPCRCQVCR